MCKWGPSVFIYRKRVFPSGKPKEKKKILIQKDPTWLSEFKYYKDLIYQKKITDFSKDIWIQKQIYKSSKNIPNVHEEISLEPITDYSKFKAQCEKILNSYLF